LSFSDAGELRKEVEAKVNFDCTFITLTKDPIKSDAVWLGCKLRVSLGQDGAVYRSGGFQFHQAESLIPLQTAAS